MEIGALISAANAAYATYNQIDSNSAKELYLLKQKIEQIIPVLDAVQQLYHERNSALFTPTLTRAMETIQQSRKVVKNGSISFIGLAKPLFHKEVKALTKEIAAVIKELTLAIVAWNALGQSVPKGAPWTPKVCVLGAPNSGKSSFILALNKQRFVEGSDPSSTATCSQMVTPANNEIQIWDLPGDSSFQPNSNTYVKQASLVLFFYSVEDPSQLQETIDWYNFTADIIPEGALVALVANKIDLLPKLLQERTITQEELDKGKLFAAAHDMLYYEVSSKTSENVEHCIFKLFSRLKPPFCKTEDPKPEISVSGYLHKIPGSKGDKLQRWQERFFVCNVQEDNTVYYYRSNQDYRRNKYAGKVHLDEVQVVEDLENEACKKPFSFKVVTPNRTWYFYASETAEKEKWKNVFSNNIAQSS